jgi:dihydroxyacetone kinase-like protein
MSKKIINAPDDVVPELTEGFIAAHSRYYEAIPDVKGVLLKQRRKDKVTLVIGGGSGHEPLFGGFVGRGLGDAAACGNIFASPDPGTICEVAKATHAGKGVLFVYGNYAGDNLNFDMAEELLNDEGIKTAHVRVWDDCASAPPERIEDRRGIAGDVFIVKVAGAACDAGLSLEEVVRVTEKARANLRSIGVATSPGQLPGNDKPTFELGPDEIEYGMGLHGEPGIERTTMKPADELVRIMYSNLVKDMPLKKGDDVCVLVNGLGSTTIMELSIVYRKVNQLLSADGVSIYDADINIDCTCMEMGGFSITVLKLDGEIKKYIDAPCFSPYYAKEVR